MCIKFDVPQNGSHLMTPIRDNLFLHAPVFFFVYPPLLGLKHLAPRVPKNCMGKKHQGMVWGPPLHRSQGQKIPKRENNHRPTHVQINIHYPDVPTKTEMTLDNSKTVNEDVQYLLFKNIGGFPASYVI